jgi:SWI/SNF-related matrix-associated actin-dependent regulator 1 of chromatin subfamily A
VLEWVENFLAESDGKLVLFAIHKNIVGELQKRFKALCVVVNGSTSNRNRQLAVDKFQQNKRCRLFIGNIKAAGVGLNLTAANTVAFAELDWVPGNHTQAEDRIHRIGQKGSASIFYLVAKGTIEDKLCAVIEDKQRVLNTVLDGNGRGDNLDIFAKLCDELQKEQR